MNTIRVSNGLDLSVLICVHTVCKDFTQRTKVAASKERVNSSESYLYLKIQRGSHLAIPFSLFKISIYNKD